MSMRDRVTLQNLVLRCFAISIGIVVGAACVIALDHWATLPWRLESTVRSAAQVKDQIHLFSPGNGRERCTAQATEWLSLRLFWPQPIVADGRITDRSFHPSSAETASTMK